LFVDSTWWLYATGRPGADLQQWSSPDLNTWSGPTDPLPQLPAWAAPGFTWAPTVGKIGTAYVMFYTARDAALGRQCISEAVSPTPRGPFIDDSAGPLICQTIDAGSIDPTLFQPPDGRLYLLWKSDDNGFGHRTRIGGQQLTADGRTLVGPRPRLLTAGAGWQDGVVEGPSMIASGGSYYLFYGANHWDTVGAAIGYAVCVTPLGPCTNQSTTTPWLATGAGIVGPSGPDAIRAPGGAALLAFHAWTRDAAGEPVRSLWIGRLSL